MTVGFVRATKAHLLPKVLTDVYYFRKAYLTLDKVLRSMFMNIATINGTDIAVSTLRARYTEFSMDCQGLRPSGYGGLCPWGLLSFVESAAYSLGVNGTTISEVEVGVRSRAATLCPTLSCHFFPDNT